MFRDRSDALYKHFRLLRRDALPLRITSYRPVSGTEEGVNSPPGLHHILDVVLGYPRPYSNAGAA
jgi:hypothetical protein